jgi:uncharacterized membrane protein
MRKYERIWKQLKQTKTSKLEAPLELHARIVKAVIKEKHKDLAFKYISAELGNSYKLAYEIEGLVITFTLNPEYSSRNL